MGMLWKLISINFNSTILRKIDFKIYWQMIFLYDCMIKIFFAVGLLDVLTKAFRLLFIGRLELVVEVE